MEIRDKFSCMSEFGPVSEFGCVCEFSRKYPQGFLDSAFITHPLDQVQQFTGATSVIDLGNFRDFKLRFIIYHDSRQGGLNSIRDWVCIGGFQHRDVEHWVYGSETVRE